MSQAKCSFCARPISDEFINKEDYVFLGTDTGICICGQCVMVAAQKLETIPSTNGKALMNEDLLADEEEVTPKIIKERLDDWIIDQELAKKRMSIAIYDHLKRINQIENGEEPIEKSNIILAGSTGSGKTAIIKAIAKELCLPLHIDDVTTISSTGYQGRNVEDILSRLLSKADGNLKLAQKGIILLDEGDKMKRQKNAIGIDVKGEGVQQGLLKITEGGVFDVKYDGKQYKFDTTNVLFVLAGAFEGIENIIAKRQNKKLKTTGGFTGPIQHKAEAKYNDLIMDVKHEDLNTFGMMPELLGRFPILTPLQELSEEALIKILTEPKNAIIKQMQKSFDMDGIKLEFDKEALRTIALKAKERKIGARGLRSIVEETLEKPKFECPGSNIKKVTIHKDLSCEFDIEKEN